jgi:hypothetical protein
MLLIGVPVRSVAQGVSAGARSEVDVEATIDLPVGPVNYRETSGEQRIIFLDALADPRQTRAADTSADLLQPPIVRRSRLAWKWLAIGAGAAGAAVLSLLSGRDPGASVTVTPAASSDTAPVLTLASFPPEPTSVPDPSVDLSPGKDPKGGKGKEKH